MTERQVSAPGRDRTLCAHCGKERRFHGAVGAWCPAHEATFTPLASSSPALHPAPSPLHPAPLARPNDEQRLSQVEGDYWHVDEVIERLYEACGADQGPLAMDLAMLGWEISALSAQVRSLRDDLDQSLSDRCREETEAFMLEAEVRSLREEREMAGVSLGDAVEARAAVVARLAPGQKVTREMIAAEMQARREASAAHLASQLSAERSISEALRAENPDATGYTEPGWEDVDREQHERIMRSTEAVRLHAKAPGAAIDATGAQPVRAGGRAGCPGIPEGDQSGSVPTQEGETNG